MTLEEFASNWKITKAHAQAYLSRYGNLQKEGKHYIYDPVRIKQAHDLRVISSMPKQPDEVDFQDIWAAYKSKVGYNKLSRLIHSKEFPEVKRECCCGGSINKRVWHKNQIDEFFKSFEEIKKVENIYHRRKKLSQDSCARINFLRKKPIRNKCGELVFLKIEPITALPDRFYHKTIWQSLG